MELKICAVAGGWSTHNDKVENLSMSRKNGMILQSVEDVLFGFGTQFHEFREQ